LKRPSWLNKKISLSDCAKVKARLRGLGLATVCEEAACPNIGECFAKNVATFLILGRVCTRSCAFCGVAKGRPPLPAPDPDEPLRAAEGVRRLGLRHAVITSVTRDDLPDGGASEFCATIAAIHKTCPQTKIEVLIPDFGGSTSAVKRVAEAAPDIIAHNVETVPRLYAAARRGADYKRSLEVLKATKEFSQGRPVKSGIMLGLGEREDEVLKTFRDLAAAGCEYLSIGQYLAPTKNHAPVVEYVTPERFDYYKKEALDSGLKSVMSGPYVRSSYLAEEYTRPACAVDKPPKL